MAGVAAVSWPVDSGKGGGRCPPSPPGYLGQSEAAIGFRDVPVAGVLPDGRLWLRHGPISIVALAEGPGAAAAHRRAVARFGSVLAEVAAHLAVLRAPVGDGARLVGIPGRMQGVCAGIGVFVTPMAAVAGAVAEAVLAAMLGTGVTRAHVNNGGDIALWSAPGAPAFRVGLVTDLAGGATPGWLEVAGCGIATSGWPGRSHSLGIADAVTVLADSAAAADVAATLVANAVDLPGHPGVLRVPACDLAPDSDLGVRLVTQGVARLAPGDIAGALDAGEHFARALIAQGRMRGAALALQGTLRLVGDVPFHADKGGCLG